MYDDTAQTSRHRSRAAWPALTTVGDAVPEAPPDVEESLARIWRRVLGGEHVGRHDNFFDLGGTSGTIAAVHDQVQHQLDVRLPVVALFEFPTIAALAGRLREGSRPAGEPVEDATGRLAANRARLAAGRARLGAQRRRTDDPKAMP